MRLARSLPKGDETRRAILTSLDKVALYSRGVVRAVTKSLEGAFPHTDPASPEAQSLIKGFVEELEALEEINEDKILSAETESRASGRWPVRGASDEHGKG